MKFNLITHKDNQGIKIHSPECPYGYDFCYR